MGPRHEAAGDQARLLLATLVEKTLHGAEAPGFISLQAEAVEAVLRLGYPWALELTPEDVAALHPARRAPLLRRTWIAGALLVLGGVAAAVAIRPDPVVVRPVPIEQPRPRPPKTPVTPTPPELKTMLSAAEMSSLVTQAQRALERRNDRKARAPLEQCLDADAKHLTCLRLLAEVEARQATEHRDAAALSRARTLAQRFLATAPADDAF
ncbi:MAG: hypothetical protein JNG84_02825, partial [Archangium sp.]|nr:hypothetical protein [Archangium sp.]